MEEGLPYFFQDARDEKDLVDLLKMGEIDCAILPLEAALLLYKKSRGGVAALSTIQSSDYYIASSEVKTLSDLVGKKVLIPSGIFSEGYLTWILKKSGIGVGSFQNEVFLMTTNSNQRELLNDIIKNKRVAIINEPARSALISTAGGPINIIDLQDHYLNITGYTFLPPKNILVIRKDFLKSLDGVKSLATAIKKSITFVNTKSDLAANLAKKHEININPAVAARAIKKASFTFITMKESRDSLVHFIELFNNVADKEYQLDIPGSDFFSY